MNDLITTLKYGSVIQHGKLNDRIYLMKLFKEDARDIITTLNKIVKENKYTKIFCKVPSWAAPLFFSNGFILEASIPQFYNFSKDVCFVSKFLTSDRLLNIETKSFNELSNLLLNKPDKKIDDSLISNSLIQKLEKEDVEQITNLYKETFISYPFPIHNPEYIIRTMDKNIQYYGIKKKGKLVALASSEIDILGLNAEMTDFATSRSFRGNNLSLIILKFMEKEMKKMGIKTLYTIARLKSIPMNKTFIRLDYNYSGTLIKNTNIAGNIESMNVYYKHI